MPVCQLCLAFGCVHRRVAEGSGVGSVGCVMHVDMHIELSCVVSDCIVIATEHHRYSKHGMLHMGLPYIQKAVE